MITIYLRSIALSKHLSNASGEALQAYLQRSSNQPAGRWPVSPQALPRMVGLQGCDFRWWHFPTLSPLHPPWGTVLKQQSLKRLTEKKATIGEILLGLEVGQSDFSF